MKHRIKKSPPCASSALRLWEQRYHSRCSEGNSAQQSRSAILAKPQCTYKSCLYTLLRVPVWPTLKDSVMISEPRQGSAGPSEPTQLSMKKACLCVPGPCYLSFAQPLVLPSTWQDLAPGALKTEGSLPEKQGRRPRVMDRSPKCQLPLSRAGSGPDSLGAGDGEKKRLAPAGPAGDPGTGLSVRAWEAPPACISETVLSQKGPARGLQNNGIHFSSLRLLSNPQTTDFCEVGKLRSEREAVQVHAHRAPSAAPWL